MYPFEIDRSFPADVVPRLRKQIARSVERKRQRAENNLTTSFFRPVVVDCQALEAHVGAIDKSVCGLQAQISELSGGENGADGSGESEALQKELLLVITTLAKSSAEVS